MRRCPHTRNQGFTLVELLTVVVILVVFAMLAAPAFTELIASQRVQTAAADLHTSLLRARSEAIKSNGDVTIAKSGSVWPGGWVVSSADGDLEVHGPTTNITITGGPASVTYRSNGRIAGGTMPGFTFGSSSTATERCVQVNLSGQPYVTKAACS